jgi:hypothetical protein
MPPGFRAEGFIGFPTLERCFACARCGRRVDVVGVNESAPARPSSTPGRPTRDRRNGSGQEPYRRLTLTGKSGWRRTGGREQAALPGDGYTDEPRIKRRLLRLYVRNLQQAAVYLEDVTNV